jgi:hypothetical protein
MKASPFLRNPFSRCFIIVCPGVFNLKDMSVLGDVSCAIVIHVPQKMSDFSILWMKLNVREDAPQNLTELACSCNC